MKYLSLFAILVLLYSCDIAGGSKKDSTSVNPAADTTLKSITVNNQVIEIKNGVIDYRYLLSSSTGLTSDVLISAVATNSSATIRGTGNKVVNNPTPVDITILDTDYFSFPQESIDTVFTITVLSEDKSMTTNYNLTVSSAPAWVISTITVPGDGSNLSGLKVNYRLWGVSSSGFERFKSDVDLKPVKTQQVAFPVPKEGQYTMHSNSEILVDLDNSGRISKGDYFVGYEYKEKIIISKTSTFNYPDFVLQKANKIEVRNIPVEMTMLFGSEGYLIYRDTVTGKIRILGDWIEDGNSWFNNPIYGTYELLLYERPGLSGDSKILSLGTHTLNESTDLVFDLSLPQYVGMVKNEKDLGPTLLFADYSTGLLTFSEPMDAQSVKDSVTIYKAYDYYNNNLTGAINIADITWNIDNTEGTLIPEVNLQLNTEYVGVLNTSAKGSSGKHVYNEIVHLFSTNTP